METKKQLQENIAKIEDELYQIKQKLATLQDEPEEYRKFVPADGQAYWVVGVRGDVRCHVWRNDGVDKHLLTHFPLFRTREDAERCSRIDDTIREIAGNHPVTEDTETWYYFRIDMAGLVYDSMPYDKLKIPHAIATAEPIADEIKAALSIDDLLFYRAVTS